MDANTPVKNKCTWWREMRNEEDAFDVRLKEHEKRWACSCFVEGDVWIYTKAEIPRDCPNFRKCRYYIKHT
jgi:hypothetical protein